MNCRMFITLFSYFSTAAEGERRRGKVLVNTRAHVHKGPICQYTRRSLCHLPFRSFMGSHSTRLKSILQSMLQQTKRKLQMRLASVSVTSRHPVPTRHLETHIKVQIPPSDRKSVIKTGEGYPQSALREKMVGWKIPPSEELRGCTIKSDGLFQM